MGGKEWWSCTRQRLLAPSRNIIAVANEHTARSSQRQNLKLSRSTVLLSFVLLEMLCSVPCCQSLCIMLEIFDSLEYWYCASEDGFLPRVKSSKSSTDAQARLDNHKDLTMGISENKSPKASSFVERSQIMNRLIIP